MRNLVLIKIAAAFSIVILPLFVIFYQKNDDAFANTATAKYTVTAANVNIRENADISSKIIGNVHQGDTFELITSKNGWDQVQFSSTQTGWISAAYVTQSKNTLATVEAVTLNVRQSPNLSSKVLGKLNFGSKITVYDEQGDWAKIGSATGIQGWVYAYYIQRGVSESGPALDKTAGSSGAVNTKSASSLSVTNDHSQKAFNPNSKQPLTGKTIVLDPGHGGKDNGTTSISGTHEKDLTLATAEAVEQKLKNAGADVIMTRTDDTYIPLSQRADLSNRNHADAFISFHYNWSNDPSSSGLIDFYYQKSRDNSLATDILNSVGQATGLNITNTRFDNLEVLRDNSQPCTLIELGFLSNKQDVAIVQNSSYQDLVAQGVYGGLLDYFTGIN